MKKVNQMRIGLSRLLVKPKTVDAIYYDHLNNAKLRQRILANKQHYRLPRTVAFNRSLFTRTSASNGLAKPRLFSSYRQLRNKFKELETKRKKDRFTKWWATASIPLVFFGVFARVKYRQNKEAVDDEEQVHPTSWKLFCYQALPLNAISRVWGKLNNIELPVWAREPGFKFYSYLFGVNLDEIEETDLTKYHNLSEFFYREIKKEVRPLADSELVSPSDGKVLSLGIINEKGEIEQVKGMNYSVKKFLGIVDKSGSPQLKYVTDVSSDVVHEEFAEINGISYTVDDLLGLNPNKEVHHFLKHINTRHQGEQALSKQPATQELIEDVNAQSFAKKKLFYTVIYLAPGDYHRFHSPANWVVQLRKYFTGELYSVAPYFQKTFANLFILNERVSLLGYWKHGFFSMTPVGATNVGSIKLNFDRELVTNSKYDPVNNEKLEKNTCYEATYFKSSKQLGGIPMVKGREMGGFQLGSTVVLVFEAPEKKFRFTIDSGDVVKMGQSLGVVEE